MVYCQECGEEVDESARYSGSCGSRVNRDGDGRSVDEKLEWFWEVVEGMIDREVERIEADDITVHPALADKFVFAQQLYIIGWVKGQIFGLLISSFSQDDEVDEQNLDFSPIYERIVDLVEEREDRIRQGLEEEIDVSGEF